jgi:hypothetical protein
MAVNNELERIWKETVARGCTGIYTQTHTQITVLCKTEIKSKNIPPSTARHTWKHK